MRNLNAQHQCQARRHLQKGTIVNNEPLAPGTRVRYVPWVENPSPHPAWVIRSAHPDREYVVDGGAPGPHGVPVLVPAEYRDDPCVGQRIWLPVTQCEVV